MKKWRFDFQTKCTATCFANACGFIINRHKTINASSKEDALGEFDEWEWSKRWDCPKCKRKARHTIYDYPTVKEIK